MPCVMATTLFWITFLTSVYFRVVAGTSLTNEPKCINGKWKAGECVCNLGYKTAHEEEDVLSALQPVYCNTTVQIVVGSYQWTEQDVLQLAAADLAVVLATASCLALIHLAGFVLRIYITAKKLDKLKQREKAFLDYISTYHQEKQLLPTIWRPPSTFQLLNAEGTDEHIMPGATTVGTLLLTGTRREKGEGAVDPDHSCIEESDDETLQTRFTQVLEQGQADGSCQEHNKLAQLHSQFSMPGMEEAMPLLSMEAGMEEAMPLLSMEAGMKEAASLLSMEVGTEEAMPLLSMEAGMKEAASLLSMEVGTEEAMPLLSMAAGMKEAASLLSMEAGMKKAASLLSMEAGMGETAPLISMEAGTHSKANASETERTAQTESTERSKGKAKRPKGTTKRDKEARGQSCSMNSDSQEVSQQPNTKRGEGDKNTRRRRQLSQDEREQKKERRERRKQKMNP